MEKLFQLKAHNTDIKTEIIAGITTFLSMVYILAINPLILSDAGLSADSVFTATAVPLGSRRSSWRSTRTIRSRLRPAWG